MRKHLLLILNAAIFPLCFLKKQSFFVGIIMRANYLVHVSDYLMMQETPIYLWFNRIFVPACPCIPHSIFHFLTCICCLSDDNRVCVAVEEEEDEAAQEEAPKDEAEIQVDDVHGLAFIRRRLCRLINFSCFVSQKRW
jgi:hypothetical protein